jgi:hypothetical protein
MQSPQATHDRNENPSQLPQENLTGLSNGQRAVSDILDAISRLVSSAEDHIYSSAGEPASNAD